MNEKITFKLSCTAKHCLKNWLCVLGIPILCITDLYALIMKISIALKNYLSIIGSICYSVEKLKTLIIYLIKVIHSLTFKRATRNNIFYFYFDLLCTVKGIKLMCHSSHIDVIYTSKMPLYELSAPILPLWPWLKL